ncbi:DUF2309 domain-containing protein [Schlesneria sp. DSM 10557]|uniref:DUF2309 domain-containing protein n=1 Tax=Schlesneria sp. DSM 10557 TaxID=3044399 RepID=UPI0035A123BE
MPHTLEQTASPIDSDNASAKATELKSVIQRAASLLPAQGPITAFVFFNTLQALEDLPFDEGVQKGARLFGCQPYLSEDTYREKLTQDRIHLDDLALALKRDLKEQSDIAIATITTRHQLRLAMLQYPLRTGPTEELKWFVAETDALTQIRSDAPTSVRDRFLIETKHWVMRDLRISAGRTAKVSRPASGYVPLPLDELIERFGKSSIERWTPATWQAFALQALWRVCRNGMHNVPPYVESRVPFVRHRDVLRAATSFDTDSLVHPVLIRFCAAFTDQGFANWSLPYREQGFFHSFLDLYSQSSGPPDRWMAELAPELSQIKASGQDPLQSVVESLEILGVKHEEWEDFITASLLALRGWTGLIWQLEARPDRQAISAPPGSLIEFLAVRLILERIALRFAAREYLQYSGPLGQLRESAGAKLSKLSLSSIEQRAFLVFQLAQVLGWSPAKLFRLTPADWSDLIHEIETFTSMERRRIFHQAFERHMRAQTLDAMSVHTQRTCSRVEAPKFQAVFCLDAREESFRRHLEEVMPRVETFGAAGFFGVPMYYKGVTDAHFTALCPIVIRPQHWITEEVDAALEDQHQRRAKTRRAIGAASHNVHVRSRSVTGGALLTASLGVLASIPLVARVLFPRLTARIRRHAGKFVEPPRMTRLHLERKGAKPGPTPEGIGFNIEEMANIGERLLRDIGLTSGFARLVLFMGHGSFCLNNPHKSCYDCGACCGGAGSPNARALAAMLNDKRVRTILRERGLPIPEDVHFLGGLHNTCTDSVTFYDVHQLPDSHRADLAEAEQALELACERNAHERCRRFQSAPLDLTFAAARRHVEGRSQDLAQTRPEFGNASNAICFVGRRARVRGLYLDRRCFLQSYEPHEDDADCSILARILGAVVPVCSGINLQYFFSYIDPAGWGSGTKLPHNVTSLLGVMDGALSDLRPGLPWQGVEIHEPVRLLMIIETTPDGIRRIMERSETVRNIIQNGWVQLALLDPDSNQILVFREDEFHRYQPTNTDLPQAMTSADWYRGWREHLGFAQICT